MIETIVEVAGFVYTLGKDAWPYIKSKHKEAKETDYKRDTKMVDINYPKDSGIQAEWEGNGYKVAWISPDRVSRLLDLEGYEYVEQIDEKNKIIWKLACPRPSNKQQIDLIFLAKKKDEESKP